MKATFARKSAARRSGPRATSAWLRQHRASIRDTAANMRVNRGSIVLSVLVIAVTLALPVGLHVLQTNFMLLTAELGAAPEVSLFLESSATRAMAEDIASNLALDDRIGAARVIDKDTALVALTEGSELGGVVDSLGTNPLPYTIALDVGKNTFDGASGEGFREHLANLPGVEDAVFDIVWIRRLEAISSLLTRLAVVIATVVGTGVLLIIGNTIRTGIQNRRDEIEVLKLCGATDAYVSRPFLYSGAAQGALGAALACAIVATAVAVLDPAVATLAVAYGNAMALINRSPVAVLVTLGIGAAMGWFGALVAVRIYLGRLDFALGR
jgi:cell division transport system permease protein